MLRSDAAVITVCAVFIFLLSFKPSEPHLSHWLKFEKGFSEDTINSHIYPVWTYTYFPLLAVAIPVAVLFPISFKPLIAVGALARVCTRFLLLYGDHLAYMVAAEACYALGSVSEVVFYSYVYFVTPRSLFTRATAISQSAFVVAHVVSGLLGDFLLYLGVPMKVLFYISAVSVCAAAASVLLFPSTSVRYTVLIEAVKTQLRVLARLSRTPLFLAVCVWWTLMSLSYQFLYAYEVSLYLHYQPNPAHDVNGSILAAALLFSSLLNLLLAVPRVSRVLQRRLAVSLAVLSLGMCAGLALVCLAWPVLVAGLWVFFPCWAVANSLFLSYCGAAVVDEGRGALDCDPLLEEESGSGSDSDRSCVSSMEGCGPDPACAPPVPLMIPFLATSLVSAGLLALLQFVLLSLVQLPLPSLFLFVLLPLTAALLLFISGVACAMRA